MTYLIRRAQTLMRMHVFSPAPQPMGDVQDEACQPVAEAQGFDRALHQFAFLQNLPNHTDRRAINLTE
jgi:hypothetical protein